MYSIYNKMTIFKVIEDFPNYQIYNDGRIYSKNINKFMKYRLDPTTGYYIITLYNKDTHNKKTCKIHRLVAKYFCQNPLNKKQVDHIDRNKLNNHYTNLRYVSNQENQYNISYKKNNKLKQKNICPRGRGYEVSMKRNNQRYMKIVYSLEEAIELRDKMSSMFPYIN